MQRIFLSKPRIAKIAIKTTTTLFIFKQHLTLFELLSKVTLPKKSHAGS